MSLPFNVTNGVRQGGILSPTLFNVYMDELSVLLNHQSFGCKINNVCFNHMFYADDSVLLAHSPGALQKLVAICEEFATSNDILYNAKKSFVMCVRPKNFKHLFMPSCFLNGNVLNQTESHKYLGVFLNEHCNDDTDIFRQRKGIFARGNILTDRFKHCTSEVKVQLFKSYCSTLYCSQLWCNHTKASYNSLRVAYNKVFRLLMKADTYCSISNLMVTNNVDSMSSLWRKNICSFLKRVAKSSNLLVNTITRSYFYYNNSIMVKKWHTLLTVPKV